MRLPRVRITVGCAMILVAVAGLAVGGWMMHGRSVRYRKLAESNASDETFYRVALSGKYKLGHPSYAGYFQDQLKYHQALRQKYERSSRYPWLSVAPDPPEPKW